MSTQPEHTPAERRELAIAHSAATLVRSFLRDKIRDIESSAAKQAEDVDNDGKPIVAKVGVTIEWPAGAHVPEVSVSLAYNLRRKTSGTIKADADQMKLEIVEGEE